MALTVEELQIVLSCDATTAQKVLDQMDATVKAYTTKFQSYFDKLGTDKLPKNLASDVKDIEKQLDKVTKAIDDKGKDWKAAYEKRWGETFEESMRKAKQGDHGEYVPSGLKYNPSESWDRYEQSQRGPNLRVVGNAGKSSIDGPLGNAREEIIAIARAAREQLGPAFATVSQNASSIFSTLSQHAKPVLQEIGLIGQYVGKGIGSALLKGANIGVGAFRLVGKTILGVRNVVGTIGSRIKKAFQSTLLGKFFKQLGRVLLRMSAMRLVNGVLNGTKQGLEQLAKVSESSGKAMNQIKAAGGSIKMALGAAVMPIVKALVPLFYKLAKAVTTAANVIAQFFARLTGQTEYTAVSISDGMDDVASSAGGAGKAVKGMLADFDELIVIGNKSGGGGGGGGGVDSSFSSVTDQIAVSAIADRIREAIVGGNWEGVGKILNEQLGIISKKISDFFDGLANKGYGTKFAQFINGVFSDSSAFESAGKAVASGVNFVITTALQFLETFDVKAAAASSTALWNSIFENVDWIGLGKSVGLFVLDAIEFVFKWLVDLDWGSVFKGVFDTIVGFLQGLLSNPQRLLRILKDMVLGVIDFLGGLVAGGVAGIFDALGMDGLAKKITDSWDGAMDSINASLDSAIDNVNTSWGSTADAAEDAGKAAQDAFNGAKAKLVETGTAATNLQNTMDATFDKEYNADVGIAGVDKIVEDVGTVGNALDQIAAHKKVSAQASVKYSGEKPSNLDKAAKSVGALDALPEEKAVAVTTSLSGATVQEFTDTGTAIKGLPKSKSSKVSITGTAASTMKNKATYAAKIAALPNVKSSALGVTVAGDTSQKIKDVADSVKALPDKKTIDVGVKATITNGKALKDQVASAMSTSVKVKVEGSGDKMTVKAYAAANGAIAYGPASLLVGEYAAASHNPEVIAPLSDLVGLLTRANAPVGAGSSSEQIRLLEEQNALLRQIARKELVFSPSAQLGQVVERSRQLYART